jgi:sarcosine oxidase
MKVAVVGLGIAGLSVAARLARAGHEVDGFEQFDLMHVRGSSHGDTRIIRLTPGEGERYVRMAAEAHQIWRDWEERAGAPLMQWTVGLMAGPAGSAFVSSCASLAPKGREPLLPGDAIHDLTRGAIAFPHEWEVCVQDDVGVLFADAARAFLIRYAGECGARLHERVGIEAPIRATTLNVNGDARAFDAMIVSAGSWAAKLLPEFGDRLVVRRRVLGWLKPRRPMPQLPVICVDNEVGLFGMPTPDGLYKIGMHLVGDRVDPDAVRDPGDADSTLLAHEAEKHLPLHEPQPVRMARCLYTMTADENFLIVPSHEIERVLMMSCCSGHGFKYAPLYGQIALAWLDGRPRKELDVFGLEKRIAGATSLGKAV